MKVIGKRFYSSIGVKTYPFDDVIREARQEYDRAVATYSPHDFKIDGVVINMKTLLFRTLMLYGNACHICRGEATHFRMCVRTGTEGLVPVLFLPVPGRPEVQMTTDHVRPLAKGGSNELHNLRPCCFVCNQKKGSEQ